MASAQPLAVSRMSGVVAREVSPVNAVPEEPEKPKKQPAKPLLVYRQLYLLRSFLARISPKIAQTQDRLLASIGYPARLLGFLLASTQLTKLSSATSDYRTLTRVLSTPATIEASLGLLMNNNNPDKLDRLFDYIAAVCGSLYQVLEDLAYFAGKGVIKMSSQMEDRLWAVSSMFWTVETLLALIRIPYYHYTKNTPISARKLIVNLAWLPLAVHWSTEKGIFNSGWVGLLGTIACWPNMVYQWQEAK